jgi:L-alanine-DL-glutamate epimerase-like enolase superfamily enzyme
MSDDLVIASVEVSAFTVPTERPEGDGTLAWDETTMVVVEPLTRGGVRGLGYAYGDVAMVGLLRQHLIPAVVGTDVRDNGATWLAMVRTIRNLGRPGLCSMAIAAMDIALWDTKGRCLEQPLHRLLGATRENVPIYGSGGFTTYTERQLVEQLIGWAEDGIPRVKMKIGTNRGRDAEVDVRRIRAVREALGPDVELFVDANGAYERTQARMLGRRFADEFGVRWFEEPVTSDDLGSLHMLVEELPLDVAAGEYGYHLEYFQQMLAARAVDVLQADAGRCAGLTEWLRVAAAAAAVKVPISAHCGPSLHAPVCTVPANFRHLEYFHDHVRMEGMLFEGALVPRDGYLWPTEHPGLGLELRRADAEQYRVR